MLRKWFIPVAVRLARPFSPSVAPSKCRRGIATAGQPHEHSEPFSAPQKSTGSHTRLAFVIGVATTALMFLIARSSAEPAVTQDSYVPSSLTIEEVDAALNAAMQRIQTYEATTVLRERSPDPGGGATVSWESSTAMKRVAGSGLEYFDIRYYIRKYADPTEESAGEREKLMYSAYDGALTYRNDVVKRPGGMMSSRGTIQEGLDASLWAQGLTIAALSTHFLDVTPIEQVVANGSFKVLGETKLPSGYNCVVVFGKYGLPQEQDFEPDGFGMYYKLFLAKDCGFMPAQIELHGITEAFPEGHVAEVYTAELQEVQPGMWFPKSGTLTYQDGKVFELEVRSVAMNPDLEDDVFRIKDWPPGTRVEDTVKGSVFTLPKRMDKDIEALLSEAPPEQLKRGLAGLEERLERDRAKAQASADNSSSVPSSAGERVWAVWPLSWPYLLVGVLCIATFLGGMFMPKWWRDVRKRRRGQP